MFVTACALLAGSFALVHLRLVVPVVACVCVENTVMYVPLRLDQGAILGQI